MPNLHISRSLLDFYYMNNTIIHSDTNKRSKRLKLIHFILIKTTMCNNHCADCIYYHPINDNIGTCLINNIFTFKDTNIDVVKQNDSCFIDDTNKYIIKHIILENVIYNNGITIRTNVITYINNNDTINNKENIIGTINNSFNDNKEDIIVDKIVIAIVDINNNCYKRTLFYTDAEFMSIIQGLINSNIIKVNKIVYDTKIIQSKMNNE